MKHQCSTCGYVYDPQHGELFGSILPGTEFEALPPNWTCPFCGAGSDRFHPKADTAERSQPYSQR